MGNHALDYRQLVAVVPAIIALYDFESLRILAASNDLARLVGQDLDQLCGTPVSELVGEGLALDWRCGAAGDRGSGSGCGGALGADDTRGMPVVQLRCRGGESRPLTLELGGLPGQPVGVAVWHDAGPREELRRLRQSDARLQALLDNTTAVVYAKDLEGRYLFINQRYTDLFGLTRAEITGKTDWDIFPPERAEAFRANDLRVSQANQSLEFEELAPHADGLHTYLSLKFVLRDEAGVPYAVCGISSDITVRKRMEATLRESEERFRQIAENLRECVWVREVSTWRLLYVNPAYEQIWGRSCQSFYAQQNAWLDAIHPADRENVQRAIASKGVRGDYEEQYRIVRPDGQIRWISDRGVPIRNEAGEVFRVAGIAEDITQRRMLEQEVSEASGHEQQRISRELHDGLGQQLTGLSYFAASLARRLSGQDAASALLIRDGLKDALAEVRRVVRGLAPVELHEEGLTVALEGLARSVQSRSGIPCEFYHAMDVRADDHTVARQLFRIAQEAVNNAVRHASPAKIEIRLESSGDHLILSIHDDGRGLPRNAKTEGMGLRIMRYRAGMIGAHLEVMSGRHQGTTITIQLQKEHSSECEAG